MKEDDLLTLHRILTEIGASLGDGVEVQAKTWIGGLELVAINFPYHAAVALAQAQLKAADLSTMLPTLRHRLLAQAGENKP